MAENSFHLFILPNFSQNSLTGTLVTYCLETDSSGDGVDESVCMREVWEVARLDALKVHGLRTEIIT